MKEPSDVKDYVDALHEHRRALLERLGNNTEKYFFYLDDVMLKYKQRIKNKSLNLSTQS